MTALEKIEMKCAVMIGCGESLKLRTIIRELCAVIEEQQRALSEMIEAHERTTPRPKSSVLFKMKFINAKEVIASTTHRLTRLADSEGRE